MQESATQLVLEQAERDGPPRGGRVLLVQHRDVADPDHGGSYTVKRYEHDGGRVRLLPDSSDPSYRPIELDGATDDEVSVIAELVEVLPGDAGA